MNEKDLGEIRRRIRPERHSIPAVVGCLVNSNKTIIAKFNQSITLGESATSEKLLAIMKKVLSGALGTNLLELEFSTSQVLSGEEHKLISELRSTKLKDSELLDKFYARVIESVSLEDNYVILLASDTYDIITKRSDGTDGESVSVFPYILCAVCPMKNVDEGICFKESDNLFHAISASSVVSKPELGFMFPAFSDRAADIYHTLYYTKSIADIHQDFIERIFALSAPMPPRAQGESFSDCLAGALGEDCSLEVIRSMHSQVSEMLEAHKASGEPEAPTLTESDLKSMLECSGVGEEQAEKFCAELSEKFGKNAEIAPKNIVNTKRFELKTPDVVVKVNPEKRELVTTQTIGGVDYILIRATEGVEVNGINIKIN